MATKKASVYELASLVQGDVVGDGSIIIDSLEGIGSAAEGQISFWVKGLQSEQLKNTRASAIIVPLDFETGKGTYIKVKNPYLASAIIHNFLLQVPFEARGIHHRAHIGEGCEIPEQVTIEPLAVIGNNVKIGERVRICSGAYVGDNAEIGDDTVLRPNVTVEYDTIIGKRVIIHAGTVIGSDGYGYAPDKNGCHVKRPQVGKVRIDDDVEIGANCCVDRAAFGETWIKAGSKIDNLVQVAHNVVVGENCLLVSQSAIAGSTTLGRNVVLGGKASATGHIHLGDGVMVAGKGGVTKSQKPGSVVGGMPAIPFKQWAKVAASCTKLPDTNIEVRRLRKEVEKLKISLENQE